MDRLDYHTIVVLEREEPEFVPYEPMEVVYPFPIRRELPAGNRLKLTAVKLDGVSPDLNWTVNGISGGNDEVGRIDGQGIYTAPSAIRSDAVVRIRAEAPEERGAAAETELTLKAQLALPWTADFASDEPGIPPAGWDIVDGKGDWVVDEAMDDGANGAASDTAAGRALRNRNVAEGAVEHERASYSPMIVGGDQQWRDYTFSCDMTTLTQPLVWYKAVDGVEADVYIGLMFRWQDPENYYEYRICFDDRVRLYRTLQGIREQLGKAVGAPFPAVGEPVRWTVAVQADRFELSAEDRRIRTDRDDAIGNGTVGFTTDFTEHRFGRIRVEDCRMHGRRK